jgi:hypothetical protein
VALSSWDHAAAIARYTFAVTTRRGFLWLCGASSTAGALLANTELIEPRVLTCVEGGGQAIGVMPPADTIITPGLAEQTRKALAALTPREVEALRKRYGIG